MMFRDLFNIPIAAERPATSPPRDLQQPGDTGTPPAALPVQREGAFVTTQSLVTFAGATSVVTMVANAAERLNPSWDGSVILIAVISGLVGLTIYLISETDPLRGKVTVRDRLISFAIAFINSCVIFSAAIGANALVDPGGAAPNSPPVEIHNGTE